MFLQVNQIFFQLFDLEYADLTHFHCTLIFTMSNNDILKMLFIIDFEELASEDHLTFSR